MKFEKKINKNILSELTITQFYKYFTIRDSSIFLFLKFKKKKLFSIVTHRNYFYSIQTDCEFNDLQVYFCNVHCPIQISFKYYFQTYKSNGINHTELKIQNQACIAYTYICSQVRQSCINHRKLLILSISWHVFSTFFFL